MYASDDCRAAILSAAHRARELAIHLLNAPKDPSLIKPFFETAMTIDEVGQTLGIVELSDLSTRLVAAAKRELSSAEDVTQLDSVVSRLVFIAETLGQKTGRDSVRSTLFQPLTNHRWPARP